MSIIAPLAGASLLILVTIAVVGILVFEILMFVDVIKNPKLTDSERILWAIGMLLVHPFVALAYYFTAYSKRAR
jgi:hypothetical protein